MFASTSATTSYSGTRYYHISSTSGTTDSYTVNIPFSTPNQISYTYTSAIISHIKAEITHDAEHEFKNSPMHTQCQFNWIHSPFDYQAKKLGTTPESCNSIPEFRSCSSKMGIALDMCREHHKITLEWHNKSFGKFPSMIKKFTTKDYTNAVKQKLEADKKIKEELEKMAMANNKADELLQKWLSPEEYNYLKEHDELELPSQYEKDTIYIVNKSYSRKVIKKVNQVNVAELCVMPLDSSFVNDDSLLAKILFIKTDEKGFLEMANHYPLVRR